MDSLAAFNQLRGPPPINLANSPPNLIISGAQLHEHTDGRPGSNSTSQNHHKRVHSSGEQGARRGRKRKLSLPTSRGQDDQQEEDNGDAGALNASSPPRKQRACDQCKQQKLRCNLVEDPYTACDRCRKFGHECKITDDFKRVAKRTQLADLEKQCEYLSQENADLRARVSELSRLSGLPEYHGLQLSANEGPGLATLLPTAQSAAETSNLAGSIPHEHTEQAQILLHLKQGQMIAQEMRQGQDSRLPKRIGSFVLAEDVEKLCWDTYFAVYHKFLPVLDEARMQRDVVYERNPFLFWTIMLIALRHWPPELESEQTIFSQLQQFYGELLKDTITKPPKSHLTIKALCLLCYWPLPVSSTTEDMTFVYTGIMMKHAMQIGLHRPSHPDDFARTRIQLQPGDVQDRLRTWVCCNIVAQDVSTGYGQPPESVYDATLNKPFHLTSHDSVEVSLQARLEIEKLANQITKTVYLPQKHAQSHFEGSLPGTPVHLMAEQLKNLESTVDISNPLDALFFTAVHLHLRLHVFFEDSTTSTYQTDLNDLYAAATSFLDACFTCGFPLSHAPNYVMQMMFAAAVALLKLLNSSFATYTSDREAGERRFWDAITAIRGMSVRSNDLPQRLAEVFAQMWKADAERFENSQLSPELTQSTIANGSKNENGSGEESSLITDLRLKRKSRMSMSHVYDSIWRWREEVDGKVRAEKLETAIKNPTSPQASTHRGSFGSSNTRPASAGMFTDTMAGNANLPGLIPFEGLGEFEIFDPMSWALDYDLPGVPTGMTPEPPGLGWN